MGKDGERECVFHVSPSENRVSTMYIEAAKCGVLYLGLGSCQLTNRRTVVPGARVTTEWSRNLHRA